MIALHLRTRFEKTVAWGANPLQSRVLGACAIENSRREGGRGSRISRHRARCGLQSGTEIRQAPDLLSREGRIGPHSPPKGVENSLALSIRCQPGGCAGQQR
jgi:hypothetical protein